MNIRYVIVNHSVAKQNNLNFAGEEAFYYYGKKGKILKATGSHIENDNFYHWPREFWKGYLLEYGYSRLNDAGRVAGKMKQYADKHNARDDYHWSETISVIAVDADLY